MEDTPELRLGVRCVSLQLFEHNEKAYRAAVQMMEECGKAAIVHPTGTGKSYIAFKLIEEHPADTIFWLSPSEYIFKTQIENLKRQNPDFPLANVHFYTYAKLMCCAPEEMEAIAGLNPTYIILDEFHRVGAECWGASTLELLKLCPDAKILGLSATNIRYLDNNRDMAEELFDGHIASEMTLGEAIVRGILPAPKYVTTVYQYQKELTRYQNRIDNLRSAGIQDVNQKYLDRVMKESAAEVVIPFLPIISLYTLIANIGLRKKVIMSERADPRAQFNNLPWKDKIGNFFMRKCGLYSLADWMVFQTPDAQSYYSEKIQKKSSIIPNPLDTDKLPERYDGEREKRIVAAGRFSEEKNFALLIDGFATFHESFPDYTLTIYGEGALRKDYEMQIQELGLGECVKLPGFASNLPEEINKAAMYISTSNHEGISNSMLEALGMGIPTIVTDCPVGGSKMFVHTGENGILIPMNDKKALVEAMTKIVENGVPKYLYVSNGMDNHETARLSFLTMNWEKAPFGRSDYLEFEVLPPKPTKFDEMVKIAKSLSGGHPFLRVDLYEINNKVYFSELTFSPCGGFMPFVPEEWDAKLGEMVNIRKAK